MAEDNTVESPQPEGGGEKTLDGLRQELAEKQEELAGLRAQREQAQLNAVGKVQGSQLKAQIARVDSEIAAEKEQLETQENIDYQLVGTGVPSGQTPEFVEPVDPEAVAKKLAAGEELETVQYGQAGEAVAADRAEEESSTQPVESSAPPPAPPKNTEGSEQ